MERNVGKKDAKTVAYGGIVAAFYIVLTLLSSAMGISSGIVQTRFSEALCILPCFLPSAIPGLFAGCIIANTITGAAVWDVVFGSLATLLGAIGTYLLRGNRWLAALPPIIANTLIIPFVLAYTYGAEQSIPILMLSVGAGEIISVGVLGEFLYGALKKRDAFLKNVL